MVKHVDVEEEKDIFESKPVASDNLLSLIEGGEGKGTLKYNKAYVLDADYVGISGEDKEYFNKFTQKEKEAILDIMHSDPAITFNYAVLDYISMVTWGFQRNALELTNKNLYRSPKDLVSPAMYDAYVKARKEEIGSEPVDYPKSDVEAFSSDIDIENW